MMLDPPPGRELGRRLGALGVVGVAAQGGLVDRPAEVHRGDEVAQGGVLDGAAQAARHGVMDGAVLATRRGVVDGATQAARRGPRLGASLVAPAAELDHSANAANRRGTDRLWVGSWNMSGWQAAKAQMVLAESYADIMAIQETHLAPMPLHWAYESLKSADFHLHHGNPVKAVSEGTFGRSCGVGFVAASGVALSRVLPVGPAWRWLQSVGRLHVVQLPPRRGLPRGLLLASVYAPLQVRQQAAHRQKFVEALLAFTHILDL